MAARDRHAPTAAPARSVGALSVSTMVAVADEDIEALESDVEGSMASLEVVQKYMNSMNFESPNKTNKTKTGESVSLPE